MTKFHSHYESLNVTRDAPAEVIRAAYRSLSQKHHPDKHSGNDEAARTMARLNAAYSVLSDADQRELYDLQILSQQRIREPNYAFQTSVDDDSAPVPYAPFAADQPEGRQRQASKKPDAPSKGQADTLLTQFSHFARGREARIVAIVFVLISVAVLPILWFLWRDNQSMMRLEQAAMYAPGTAANTADEAATTKPSGIEVIQVTGPSGLDGSGAELSRPAAPQKAPAAPAAAAKGSDFERLTAMLKNMGLGLHKLDLPTASPAKPAAAPAKAAEPAKAASAPVQAARTGAAPETVRAREEAERPAAPEPARGEAKSVADTSRASTPPAASAAATAATASAGRARSAVVVDARACPTPKYPNNSYYNGESGSVVLALLVGNDGKVIESKVQKSSGFPELDRAARRSLSQCKFQAVSGDGQGEPVWTNLTYVWSIE